MGIATVWVLHIQYVWAFRLKKRRTTGHTNLGFYDNILASHTVQGTIRMLLVVVAVNSAEIIKNKCREPEGKNISYLAFQRSWQRRNRRGEIERRTRIAWGLARNQGSKKFHIS